MKISKKTRELIRNRHKGRKKPKFNLFAMLIGKKEEEE